MMSPMITTCPICGGLKEAGQPCRGCRDNAAQAKKSEKVKSWSIWNRHKGEVKNKHQKVEDK